MILLETAKKNRVILLLVLLLMTFRGYLITDMDVLNYTRILVVVLLLLLFVFDCYKKKGSNGAKEKSKLVLLKASYAEVALFFVFAHFDYLYIYLWEYEYIWPSMIVRFLINLTFSKGVLLLADKLLKTDFEEAHKEFYIHHKQVFDVVVYFMFGILLLARMFYCTMIPGAIGDTTIIYYSYIVVISLLLVMAIVTLYDVENRLWLLVYVGIIVFAIVHYGISGNAIIFTMFMLMIAFIKRSPNVILLIFIFTSIFVSAAAFVLSDLRMVPDLIYFNSESLLDARHAMGIIYPTDAAARITYIVMAYCIIKKKELKWYNFIDYIALIMAFLLCKNYMIARSNMGWILITVVLTLLFQIFVGTRLRNIKVMHGIFKVLSLICVPMFLFWGLISHYYVINYEEGIDIPGSAIIGKLFGMRSIYDRLSISKRMYTENPPTLLGNNIGGVGNGGTTVLPKEYTFIDISYMRFSIIHGIIFAVIFLALLTYLMFRLFRTKNYLAIAIIAVVAVSGFLDHHLEEWHYNIFATLVFANLEMWKIDYGKKGKEKNSN